MNEDQRRVTLTKAQAESPTGQELIALLTWLSADGMVSREEMSQLRSWLEVDHGVDFPALPFLYEVIDQISSDGEVSEDELDRLAFAIERVLPKDVRAAAALRRKQNREARRVAERESRRQALIADRSERRAAKESSRLRAGILYDAEFAVRGAFRSSNRRDACERLVEGDSVALEREPDNAHDPNAILVLGDGDCEMGYVPRDEARELARLMDDGGDAEAVVRRLWETPEGQIVPILKVKIRHGELNATAADNLAPPLGKTQKPAEGTKAGRGCATVAIAVCLLIVLLTVGGIAVR
jgi:hypothetical protein